MSKDTLGVVATESSNAAVNVDKISKKERKEKRKSQVASSSVSGEGTPEDHKADKRKNKKKRKAEAESVEESQVVPGDAMDVDEPATAKSLQSKTEKKKKRKRDTEVAQDEPSAESTDKERKKKKKKAKTDSSEASPLVPSSSEPSDVQSEILPSIPSKAKKEKKSKKDKKPAQSEPPSSSPAVAVASTSIPSSEATTAFLARHSITIYSDQTVTPIVSFTQLDIPAKLKSAFDGFTEPTPIQACAWPPALAGQDVVGIAETGSGKTLAFGIPALVRIASTSYTHSKPVALVVAPTRELAIQIHDAIAPLGTSFNIRSVAIFGGVDKNGQIRALQQDKKDKGGPTTRIVVGTPGRILDLINDRVLDLSEVHYLVLDEADRMLDKGFENDIRKIIEATKEGAERQTLMFSATWPDAVRRLASTFQKKPVRVTVGSDDLTANSRVEQMVEVFEDSRSKDYRLVGHLKTILPKNPTQASVNTVRVLVFALYKKEADRVEAMLRSKGFTVIGLHGDMNQNARMDALQRFKSGETPVLVATDVAARGLDIPNVAAVINYTFPLTIEDYIHRIGRTGRGGKSGKSITFFTGDNHERSLAGELARVLRESGFESEDLKEKFPMTIKKKTHSVYGAFYRDDIAAPAKPTKIVF
ncbi:hypothetical protein EUX98_g1589 [Antrodiella citrinella]|uniref:RNA helicase n=1 Tax=Antrodiella citrinella TaxID=2447956 RepID=A0A4S4N144_9APHY|nr:hypothetical protein EUX98_g1589 [Antrodiella citrinella]